jgi:N-acetylneuraminic acid mutarotase
MKEHCLIHVFCLLSILSNSQNWTPKSDLPIELAFPVVVELNGYIHVIGGGEPAGATDIHIRYNPATDTWDSLAFLPYIAQQPAGAVVNGKIHFCGGGYPTSGQRLDLHYYYDPDSNAWYPAATLPVAVAIHKCVELDGKLFVLSGQPDKTLCESYDPVSDSWTQLNALPDMNFWYGVIVNANNTIYRFGGGGYSAPVTSAHKYDKVNDTWIPVPSLPVPLHGAAGANVGDSLIWIIGGYNNGDMNKVWVYNINNQSYTLTDSIPLERSYHSAVNAGGCIYSVGGNNNGAPHVSLEMLQNCSPNFPAAVSENKTAASKPYTIITSPSDFHLQLKQNFPARLAAVKLVDMQGRMVITRAIGNDRSISLSSDEVLPGKYIVLVAVDNASFVEQWTVMK